MQRILCLLIAAGALIVTGPAVAQKSGGVLKMYFFDSPASMSIHEESTRFAITPAMGVFNNGSAYPPRYTGVLFFGDSKQSFIRTIKDPGYYSSSTVTDFALGAGRPVHFATGPNGLIYYASSSAGQIRRIEFPAKTITIAVPANYDGDNKADTATFSTGGAWFIRRSSDGATSTRNWGTTAPPYAPVPADYDGDGKADFAVHRADLGRWRLFYSTGGQATIDLGFPSPTNTPVPADYDGDHLTDLARFNPNSGPAPWLIRNSSGGTRTVFLGLPGDLPVAGDYDGDGRREQFRQLLAAVSAHHLAPAGEIAGRADGDRPAQDLLAALQLVERELARNAAHEIERPHAPLRGDVAGRQALAGEARHVGLDDVQRRRRG
jgi:hypothetical protein